jgi:plasmid maintenance system antidote protein VapI
MNTVWENDNVQFPRLLAEIVATQELDLTALAEAMDLSIEEINELFDRADIAWEMAKRNVLSR